MLENKGKGKQQQKGEGKEERKGKDESKGSEGPTTVHSSGNEEESFR